MKVLEPCHCQALLPGEASVRLRDPRRQAGLAESTVSLLANYHFTPVEHRHRRLKMIGQQLVAPAGVAQGDCLACDRVVPLHPRLLAPCVERHLVQPSRQEER